MVVDVWVKVLGGFVSWSLLQQAVIVEFHIRKRFREKLDASVRPVSGGHV